MSKLTITTNNCARDILYWQDLTEKEKEQFDYLDSEEGQNDAWFFRYRGIAYDLGEFSATHGMEGFKARGWHVYHSDSFFSGILVKYVDNYNSVIVATYYS
jgi:hypothetical protein